MNLVAGLGGCLAKFFVLLQRYKYDNQEPKKKCFFFSFNLDYDKYRWM